MNIQKLELKSGREKPVINKHPWIFSGGVKTFPKAKNGEIIAVIDNKGTVIAHGFYSANSQIVCRLFDFEHSEKENFTEDYWFEKFNQAFQLRTQFIDFQTTNCYRLIHAEGDFLPGIIIDIYNNVAVMQVLTKGTENLVETYYKCLKKLNIHYLYIKTKISSLELENITLVSGWYKESNSTLIEVIEHNIKFQIDIEKGQKTGFFIDQRENRQLLKQLSSNKTVLNTFCYTGGFSVYALAGNAAHVHSVDISKDAIKLCDELVLHNSFTKNHESTTEDCFDFLRTHETQYDIVILDPPAFAKNAKSVHNACRGYKELNMLGLKKVKQKGFMFTFSCSQNIDKDLFQKVVFSAAADANRNVRIIRFLGQPEDHPVNIFHPESEYLKGLLLYVE